MVSSDFRKEAREKLTGKWKKVVLITLIMVLISAVLNYIDKHTSGILNFIVSIATIVIDVPLAYGLTMSFLNIFDGKEDVELTDFCKDGFNNFSRSWSVAFNIFLKLLVPFILLFVSIIVIAIGGAGALTSYMLTSKATVSSFSAAAIIGSILTVVAYCWLIFASYYYQLSVLVAIENPDMTGKDAVLESKRLMENKRWKLFCLQLSFIGWVILGAIPFGIGLLWVLPYVQFAIISFYKHTLDKAEVIQ